MQGILRTTAIIIAITNMLAICQAQQTYTIAFSYDLDGNRARQELLFSRAEGNDGNEEANDRYWPSVTDVFETMEVSLYPNPATDQFFVEIKGGANNHTEAALTLVSGSILETRIIKSTSESFDLSNLPPGMYLFKLTVDKETRVWKVVKKQ